MTPDHTKPIAPEEAGLAKMAEDVARVQSDRPSEPPMERAIEILWSEIAEVERARNAPGRSRD